MTSGHYSGSFGIDTEFRAVINEAVFRPGMADANKIVFDALRHL